MINIREAQVHQTKPGEMTIPVVRGRDYRVDDEHALRREAAKRVRDDMSVNIEYMTSLPRKAAAGRL